MGRTGTAGSDPVPAPPEESMLASLVLAAAAAMPLAVWPEAVGPPDTVVDAIEVYTVEPEDDFWIIAVQPLNPPAARDDTAAVEHVVAVAVKLGADAVVLLAELPEAAVPDDVDAPLVPTARIAGAAYVSFLDPAEEEEHGLRRASGAGGTGRTQAVAAAGAGSSDAAGSDRRHSLEPITESTRKAAYSAVVGYSPLYR